MRQTQPTAALAGIPSGLQGQGPWLGRRQIFVRFAGEAETATMYTAQALLNELRRATSRSSYHSLAIGGRDALGNSEFLAAALGALAGEGSMLPVLLATDGQRPEALRDIEQHVTLVQVAIDPASPEPVCERALETLRAAARARRDHALVIAPGDAATDGQVLRVVERAHAASPATIIVVHPDPGATPQSATGEPESPRGIDTRWTALMERLVALHADTRLMLRIPAPVGMT